MVVNLITNQSLANFGSSCVSLELLIPPTWVWKGGWLIKTFVFLMIILLWFMEVGFP